MGGEGVKEGMAALSPSSYTLQGQREEGGKEFEVGRRRGREWDEMMDGQEKVRSGKRKRKKKGKYEKNPFLGKV